MKHIFLLFCIFSLSNFALTFITQSESLPDYLLYPKLTVSPYNQVNPSFNYPESTKVSTSQANIPYLGEAYSGYITVNPQTLSKIFYVVYPAGGATQASATLNNTAPLILWLQGGPGCADGMGNYAEIGPYAIVNQSGVPTPQAREINWNDEYNLLFVDSPAGVGYSVSGNEIYTTAYGVAEYLQTFLIRFFEVYPSLAANDFYIFGESYGGHYVPALATIIVQNITQNGINLKGLGVGNGCSDVYHQAASTSDLAFALGLLDQKNRDKLASLELQAQKLTDNGNLTGAQVLVDQVGSLISELDFNINQYNFEVYNPEVSDWAPYQAWLDQLTTKQAYGVDPTVSYQDCVECENDFMADFMVNYALNYTFLLSQTIVPDLKIMIYGGQNDMVCNNSGVLLFLERLGWSGISGFINSKKQILKDSQGNVVGNYKHYDQFTFAIIYAAGHMSPGDQPATARLILEHFMQNTF